MAFLLHEYLHRLQIHQPIYADKIGLFLLHHAHFYNVPFENLDMDADRKYGLDLNYLIDKIVYKKRGGICYEFCTLLSEALNELGFEHSNCLARVHSPVLTGATHQVFIIKIKNEDWLFDIGFGAKGPRAPILLKDGAIYEHQFHSTKIVADRDYGLVVYVKENIKSNDVWEAMYSFYNQLTTPQDVELSYFYTVNSVNSLLNKNRVISLPTDDGRKSIRNRTYTEIHGSNVNSFEIHNPYDISRILNTKFGVEYNYIKQ
jgi:N-hydroxyarylamine O-acetyltransferase